MEYLIGVILIIALFMVLPSWNRLKELNEVQKLDGGYFGRKPKSVKKKTRKKTAKVVKPKTIKRKVVKKTTRRKPKK